MVPLRRRRRARRRVAGDAMSGTPLTPLEQAYTESRIEVEQLRAALVEAQQEIERLRAAGPAAHARNQSEADGFQDGWHAALKRVSDGDDMSDLTALVPTVEPFRNQFRNMKAALHGSEARLYPDATYEKYLDELSTSLADMVADAEPDSLDDAALRQAADAISHLRRTRDELRSDLNKIALAALPAPEVTPK